MLTALLSMVLGLVPADSGPPPYLSFNGIVTDQNGEPVEGQRNIVVRLYGSESSLEPLFTETHPAVQVRNGILGITIGGQTAGGLPAEIFAGGEVWLGITVENDAEMTPRMRILSVPYAFECVNTQLLQGKPAEQFAAAQHWHTVLWNNLADVPAGFSDGVDNSPTQAEIETFSKGVCYDSPGELRATLDSVYAAADHDHGGLGWGDSCAADSDLVACDNCCGEGTLQALRWFNLRVNDQTYCVGTSVMKSCTGSTCCGGH